MLDAAIIILVCIWFLITVLAQFDTQISRRIFASPIRFLVTGWNFFSPKPLMQDSEFWFRACLDDGTVTDWLTLTFPKASMATRWIWNPDHQYEKALATAASSLLLLQQKKKTVEPYPASFTYLFFLNLLLLQPRVPESVSIQFLIVRSFRDPALRTVKFYPAFLSPWHCI